MQYTKHGILRETGLVAKRNWLYKISNYYLFNSKKVFPSEQIVMNIKEKRRPTNIKIELSKESERLPENQEIISPSKFYADVLSVDVPIFHPWLGSFQCIVKGFLNIAKAKDEVIEYLQKTRTTQCGK